MTTSALSTNLLSEINISDNIIQIKQEKKNRYNKQAAYYALPKVFIYNFLSRMSPTTTKVFLALTYFTDPFNIIKYPEKISHSNLKKITGIKKADTISNAFKELVDLKIIAGYSPGKGSENTKFYFTFDIDHYQTEECCFKREELNSYYNMLLNNKISDNAEANDKQNDNKKESLHFDADEKTDIKRQNYSIPDKQKECLPEKGAEVYHIKGEGSPEKRETINTINNSINIINSNSDQTKKINFNSDSLDKNLIELTKNSESFKKQFNDFCIRDDYNYRKNTFFWTIKHASDLKLSLEEIIDSLQIANDKGKFGKMSYLIGIMKKKAVNKTAGIVPVGKPKYIQVIEYFEKRFACYCDHLKTYNFDFKTKKFSYSLKDSDEDDQSALRDFIKFVMQDIQNHSGIALTAVEEVNNNI